MEEAFCFPTCTYLEKHIKHVFSIYFSDGLEPVQAPHTASQKFHRHEFFSGSADFCIVSSRKIVKICFFLK